MTLALLFAAALLAQKPAPKPAPAPPPAPPLLLTNPLVSQFEDGAPLGAQKLIVGEAAFFRFTIADFKTSDEGVVKLTGHAQVFDPRGVPLAPPEEVGIATSLRQEDKDWQPRIHTQFQLPTIAPPGVWTIRFDATDEQTHRKATAETTFEVEGRNVPPSPTLAIPAIGFSRDADEEIPLAVAAYKPGDAVWVKFDITGYKYGEQNSIDVTYDVAVTGPDGKQVFAQENAASEKSQASYPQPWVPGAFSLTLTPDTSKGAYTLSLTAHDAVGKQTITQKAEFKVE